MTPEYCQNIGPMYTLAGATGLLATYYGKLALKESNKSVNRTYAMGSLLFFAVAAAILVRGLNVTSRDNIQVDQIYSDVYNHSKEMTRTEKARLSALFSQAKYGDAPVSMYSYISAISQAIAGFGYQQTSDPSNPNFNWELWSNMRGTSKNNATKELVSYTCKVFDRIKATNSNTGIK